MVENKVYRNVTVYSNYVGLEVNRIDVIFNKIYLIEDEVHSNAFKQIGVYNKNLDFHILRVVF